MQGWRLNEALIDKKDEAVKKHKFQAKKRRPSRRP